MTIGFAMAGIWPLAFLVSWYLTVRVTRYAVAREILDHPNARSSHDVPTPRGGGLAIVATVLASVIVAALCGILDRRTALALGGGGAAIACVGWLDDRRSLPSSIRFAVHVASASGAVALLGGLPVLTMGVHQIRLGMAGSLLAVLTIVWLLNLWNFMDGIDGIAGGEGLIAGLTMGLLLWPSAPGLAVVALAISAACAGFLVLNWHPAKIFMGDVGSATIGFLLATLALASERVGAVPLVTFAIVVGVFIFDATVTLIRRILAGERWHQAHRAHAYQRAVQSGRSHRQVSTASVILSTLLAVAAAITARRPGWTLPVIVVAFATVSAVYWWVEREQPYRPPLA